MLLWVAAGLSATSIAATSTGSAVGNAFLPRGCVEVSGPTTLEDNTHRIQTALDAAPGTAVARGCVTVAPGDWYVSGVSIRSNTTLLIQPKARLVSKINVTATAVVHIDQAEHVELGGGGGVHGHAEEAWSYFSDKDARMAPVAVDGSMARPNTLLISNSHDVHVHHVFLHNSTDWTFKMVQSSNIYVDSIDIYGDERFPNNDGFDPMSCTNVTLVNSHISVADDGICPKANEQPLQGLTVRNTTVRSRSGAIKFGSNTGPGKMSDILFDNITIWSSNGGMKIQARGGGDTAGEIVNVTWSNIVIETEYHAPRWWGNGEWLGVSNNPRNNKSSPTVIMRQLRFINITGRSENGGLLSGITGAGVEDVHFENIHINIGAWSNYSQGSADGTKGPIGPGWPAGVMCQEDIAICTFDYNGSLPQQCVHTDTPPPSPSVPARSMPCMGTRDYRPHDNGNCDYYCRMPGKADGLFIENAHGVVLKNVTFEYDMPRRSWFGDCIVVDNRSTGIIGAKDVRCINGGG